MLQPDGKLVAAGTADGPNGIPDFALMRLDVNGVLDASFSGDGMALYDLGGGDCAYSAQLLTDGQSWWQAAATSTQPYCA